MQPQEVSACVARSVYATTFKCALQLAITEAMGMNNNKEKADRGNLAPLDARQYSILVSLLSAEREIANGMPWHRTFGAYVAELCQSGDDYYVHFHQQYGYADMVQELTLNLDEAMRMLSCIQIGVAPYNKKTCLVKTWAIDRSNHTITAVFNTPSDALNTQDDTIMISH